MKTTWSFWVFIVVSISTISSQDLTSPCPRLFQYEPINSNEPDRWYGQLTMLSDSDLNGVWLRLILSKPSTQLGNWFGEVSTKDNKEYLIKNRNHVLKANEPHILRFYIKYDTREAPPILTSFRLNAKTICPEGGNPTTETSSGGQLITSSELVTTSRTNEVTVPPFDPLESVGPVQTTSPGGSQTGGTFFRPGGGFNLNPSTEDDDYFQGDFSYLFKPRPEKPAISERCGIVIKAPRPLITYGQQTEEGEFPWHAALYHSKGIDLTYVCGASLISTHHLITVAHCATRRKSKSPLPPDSLVIYLGKFYLKTWSNPGIQDRHVERIFVHEQYDPHTFSHDIAMLKLITPIDITNYVRPICLWEDAVSLDSVVGKLGTVVGWGFDETGKVTEQLSKAHMPVVSQETCIYSFPDFYSRFTSEKTYCAGFKNGTSVCNGDSGGGMVFPKQGSSSESTVWYIRGMVSISVALQNQFKCDSSHYVVFTDIAKYLDWVKNNLRQ